MVSLKRDLRIQLDRTTHALSMDILDHKSETESHLRLTNISRKGMFVVPAGPVQLEAGKTFHFAIDVGDADEVRGVGMVRWIRPETTETLAPRGYGIEVLEFHDNAERNYCDYLEGCILSLKVSHLMRHKYFSVYPDTAIKSAIEILNREKTDVLLITNSVDRPVGLLSAQEIVKAAQNTDFDNLPVSQFMICDPYCLSPEQAIDSVYSVIRGGTIDYLPVVDDGVLVGLLTVRDLIPYWAEWRDLQSKRFQETFERAVSVMAHDLRSPIGVVRTTNALLTSGELSVNDFVSAGLPDVIESNCDLVLSLVDEILDLEQVKAGAVRLDRSLIDLEDIVDRVSRCFSPSALAKDITLEVDIPTAVPKIKADPRRLEQILNNLVSNAIKYCEPDCQIVIGIKTHHSRVAIWVADNGPGIPEHEVHKLFREFSPLTPRPSRGEKSHGLGLAITKKLIEAHGGSIRVDTEAGEGTTFTVFLPIGVIQ